MTYLETTYYVTQIIAFIILAYTAVQAKKQYEEQLLHTRIAKAAELAKHFKENLIPSFEKMQLLFEVKSLKPIFDKIDPNKIKRFDLSELNNLINPDEIIIFKAALALNVSIFLENLKDTDDGNKRLSSITTNCLNDLEYFCINFNSKIADTATVYQSLHQVLFDTIPIIYIFIASNNTSGVDKYFTNIIAVYNTWREIYCQQLSKECALRERQNSYINFCNESTVLQPPQIK